MQCLHLTPWMHGPFLYTGSLTGLNMTGRWNINAMPAQSGFILNICSSGYGYTTGVNRYETGVCRYYQSGTGYGQKVLSRMFISPPLDSGKLLQDILYSGMIPCTSRGSSTETGYFSLHGYMLIMGSGGNVKATLAEFNGTRTFSSGFREEEIPQNYTDVSYTTQLGDRLVVELGAKSLNTNTGWKRFQTAISSFDSDTRTLSPYPLDINNLPPYVPPNPSFEDILKRYDIPYTPLWDRNGDDGSLVITADMIDDILGVEKPPTLYTEITSDKYGYNHYVAGTGSYEGDSYSVNSSVSGDYLAAVRTITTDAYAIQNGMRTPKDSEFITTGKQGVGAVTYVGNPWYENVSELYSYANASPDAGASVTMKFKRKR